MLFNARKGFYDTLHSYLQNLCKGDNTGRLLKYDASTGKTTTLLSGLWYANGVALSADFKDVMVVETNLNRVHRYSLTTGKTEVFVDKIPAMPDGISRSADGGFWIGGVVRLSPLPRLLAPYPKLRTLVSHIVGPLLPVVAKPAGLVFKVDSTGEPADALYDLTGEHVSSVSAVARKGALSDASVGTASSSSDDTYDDSSASAIRRKGAYGPDAPRLDSRRSKSASAHSGSTVSATLF